MNNDISTSNETTMLDQIISTGKKATCDGFGAGLLEVGQQNDQVIALCADLVGSLKMQHFIKEFPSQAKVVISFSIRSYIMRKVKFVFNMF